MAVRRVSCERKRVKNGVKTVLRPPNERGRLPNHNNIHRNNTTDVMDGSGTYKNRPCRGIDRREAHALYV